MSEIVKELTNIQPDISTNSKLHHSAWVLVKRMKATKQGRGFLSTFVANNYKWLMGHIIADFESANQVGGFHHIKHDYLINLIIIGGFDNRRGSTSGNCNYGEFAGNYIDSTNH